MVILTAEQIRQKTRRLAIEILEHNLGENEIIFAGINNNGYAFAERLKEALGAISNIPTSITRIRINPANPTEKEITIDADAASLRDRVVIIVDDVANTGRTLFYAMKPFMNILPKKIEVAVLVNRSHKQFPIQADYFGLALATTLQENIEVNIRETQDESVTLN